MIICKPCHVDFEGNWDEKTAIEFDLRTPHKTILIRWRFYETNRGVRLTHYEKKVLAAFADTLIPKSEILTESVDDIHLVDRVESHLGFISPNLAKVFRLILFLFDFGSFLTRGRRFVSLKEEDREKYLESWRVSGFYLKRLFLRLLTSMTEINYYSHPEVSKKIGFTPPPIRPRSAPPSLPSLPEQDLYLDTDVCVIGSGAGGAVVAKELSEKGHSVVLLEEGGYFGIQNFGREPLEIVQKVYRQAGSQTTIGLPAILLPTGKAVGGTTVVNSGTCFRLPEKVFARWRSEYGLEDLTAASMASHFDRVEKEIHVNPVSDSILGENAKIFKSGLEKLGFHGAPLQRNVQDCQGAGMCCFGCPNDAKQSMHLSYIPKALEYGTKLYSHCLVETIIPKGSHGGFVAGTFMDPQTGTPKCKIHVSARVVVLAAGTLNTPWLLRKNQIAFYNRHIGRHLTIHPAGKIMAEFDREIRGWEGVPQGFFYHGLADEGITFEGAFTPPSFGSYNLDVTPKEHKRLMEKYANLACFGFMVTDEGRGWIRWLPNGDPIVYYSIRKREVEKFKKAYRLLTEVMLAAGAKRIFTSCYSLPIITPEMGAKAFDTVTLKRTDFELAAFHPLGTCRMGTDASNSVVNSVGEVHGITNLFIADGSIFPTPLGVNPQETIMAFATRIAEFIDQNRLSVRAHS